MDDDTKAKEDRNAIVRREQIYGKLQQAIMMAVKEDVDQQLLHVADDIEHMFCDHHADVVVQNIQKYVVEDLTTGLIARTISRRLAVDGDG